MANRFLVLLALAVSFAALASPAARPIHRADLSGPIPVDSATGKASTEARQPLEWSNRGIPADRDTAAHRCEIVLREIERSYRRSADSIRHGIWNSLSQPRRDSLKALYSTHVGAIEGFARQRGHSLDSISSSFSFRTRALTAGRSDTPSDVREARRELQSEWTGVLQEFLEGFRSALADSVETLRDEYSSFAGDLSDRERDELEERENSSHLAASAGYTSRVTYRGVDGGATSQAIVPSLAYNFRFGLSLAGTAYRLLGTEAQWDKGELSASYEHPLAGGVSGSVAYTHYFFAGSSKTVIADLKNEASAGVSYDAGLFSPTTTVVMAFGGGRTDIYWGTGISGHVLFLTGGRGVQLSCNPGVSISLGTQSLLSQTILERKLKAQAQGNGQGKGKGVGQGGGSTTTSTTTTTSTSKGPFAVTAYDFSLPFRLEYGTFFAVPEVTVAVPMNQPSGASDATFGYFTLTIGAIIR